MALFRIYKGLLWLVAVALVLRAFIPLGYMPDLERLAKGQIQMVVCTGSGPQTVIVPGDFDPAPKNHPDATPKSDHQTFCSVGISLAWLALPIAFVLLFVLSFAGAPIVYARQRIIGQCLNRVVSLSARGPPVFSKA